MDKKSNHKRVEEEHILTAEVISDNYDTKTAAASMIPVLALWIGLLLFLWLITGRNWLCGIIFGVIAIALIVAAIITHTDQKSLASGKYCLVESVLEKKIMKVPPKNSDNNTDYILCFKGYKKKYVFSEEYHRYKEGDAFYILQIDGKKNIKGYFSKKDWKISPDDFECKDGVYRLKKGKEAE